MSNDWNLKDKEKQLIEEGSATIKDVYDCFLKKDIDVLRSKLIKDFKTKEPMCNTPWIDDYVKTINKRFGVDKDVEE